MVQCALEAFDIDKCPPYVAVSYTWGPPDVCETVMVNGSPLQVRENLHAVLSVLRTRVSTGFSEDPARENKLMGEYFWVDAICINQNDVHERGHQVNLMAQIFSKASCAVAWLGPESRNSRLAIHAIRTGNPRKVHQIQVDHQVYVNKYCQDRHEIQSALVSLLARPYWRRMWVVQEFALPKNLLLLCGRRGVWWEKLLKIVSKGRGELQSFGIEDEEGPLAGWWTLGNARNYWQVTLGDTVLGAKTLDQLLEAFYRSECSDPRDRVYALLSLVKASSDTSSVPLRADYTITTCQLYYRVLGHLRASSSPSDSVAWTRFRTVLAEALEIPRADETFTLNETLYDIAELVRDKRLVRHRQSKQYMGTLIQQYYHAFHVLNAANQEQACELVLRHFESFPRDDDPEAWQNFEKIVQIVKQCITVPDSTSAFNASQVHQQAVSVSLRRLAREELGCEYDSDSTASEPPGTPTWRKLRSFTVPLSPSSGRRAFSP